MSYILNSCLPTRHPSNLYTWSDWQEKSESYPKVDVEVACTAKLAVAHLESHGHLVVLAQALVEALDASGWQHDVVRHHSLESHGGGEETPRS